MEGGGAYHTKASTTNCGLRRCIPRAVCGDGGRESSGIRRGIESRYVHRQEHESGKLFILTDTTPGWSEEPRDSSGFVTYFLRFLLGLISFSFLLLYFFSFKGEG